jgi:hypothetical protein
MMVSSLFPDQEAFSAIATAADPAERVLWAGRPRQGIVLRSSDWVSIPFAAVWLYFVVGIFTTTASSAASAPFPFEVMPFFFVAVGLYLLVGRFIVEAWQRANTFYGLTTECVYIVERYWTGKTRSVSLRTMPELSIEARGDGPGTITFGTGAVLPVWGGWPGRSRLTIPAFDSINDARAVYQLIREAQRALLTPVVAAMPFAST